MAIHAYVSSSGGGGGGEQWTRVTLAADYTSTLVASLENVPGTSVTLNDNAVYLIRGRVEYANNTGTNSTATSIYLGAASLDGRITGIYAGRHGNTWAISNQINPSASAQISDGGALNAGLTGFAIFDTICAIKGTNRTIRFRIFQNTANAHCTLKAGSFYEYLKLE
jgi:hypothetical protein